MKVVLAPYGSRGDVEPMLALALALRRRGHMVTVCAPDEFQEGSLEVGVRFESAGSEFRGIFDGSQSDEQVFMASLAQAPLQMEALFRCASHADLVVGAALNFAAPTVAEVLGVRYRYAVYSPMYLRSASLPPFGGAQLPLPSALERRRLWEEGDTRELRSAGWLQREREKYGLRPLSSLHMYLLGADPVLGAFDGVLSPLPSDALPAVLTGHWRLPEQWLGGAAGAGGGGASGEGRVLLAARPGGGTGESALPEALEDFLRAGPPPVYVGFGSMRHRSSRTPAVIVAEQLLAGGERVLVAHGWSEAPFGSVPDGCFLLEQVNHDAVLPRVAAAVHHGGAGTTVAVARAGAPHLVVPHLGDQFYHGMRVQALGLGVAPLPLAELTEQSVSRSLGALLAALPGIRERAGEFAVGLRAREGSERAAELLERGMTGRR